MPKAQAEVDVPNAEVNPFALFGSLWTRQRPALLRPITFTLGVGICTFTAAAYLSRRESQELARKSTKADASIGELRNERIMLEVAQARRTCDWLRETRIPEPITWCYAWLATRWINYSDGERVGVGLIAANMIVFLAWQVPLPAMRFFMVKHFMHHPLSGRSYTLLTSVFSHMVSYSDCFPLCRRHEIDLRPESRSRVADTYHTLGLPALWRQHGRDAVFRPGVFGIHWLCPEPRSRLRGDSRLGNLYADVAQLYLPRASILPHRRRLLDVRLTRLGRTSTRARPEANRRRLQSPQRSQTESRSQRRSVRDSCSHGSSDARRVDPALLPALHRRADQMGSRRSHDHGHRWYSPWLEGPRPLRASVRRRVRRRLLLWWSLPLGQDGPDRFLEGIFFTQRSMHAVVYYFPVKQLEIQCIVRQTAP